MAIEDVVGGDVNERKGMSGRAGEGGEVGGDGDVELLGRFGVL